MTEKTLTGDTSPESACSALLPLRIFGIVLEYDAVSSGDITKLSYSSYSKILHIEHGLPFTGTVVTTETGYAKFMAIRRMMNRKPKNKRVWRKVSVRMKEWRKPDARYDESNNTGERPETRSEET